MPNKFSQFYQELKRRNVIRVITIYAGAAFVILELVSMSEEPFGLPDWTFVLAVILLSIGFIISVILSWIYDVHPDRGMVKTEPVDKVKPEDIPKSSNGWKIASYISFVVIVGLIVLNIIPRSGKQEILDKSIAVLPFVNDSQDQENEHFINGIMEELLINLQTIKELRVPGRTSTEQYRGNPKPITEIASEMNVAYIVEGSGQRYGDNIRLRVQLVEGATDRHIWADSYEEIIYGPEDIFRIQSEIAREIAAELQAVITPTEKILMEKVPTNDMAAYDYFLRARQMLINSNYGKQELEHILQVLDEAIALDPDFAQAYALKGQVLFSGMRSYGIPMEIWRDSALALTEKAIEIDPTLAEGYRLRGNIKNVGFGLTNEYRKDLEEAYRLAPGDADVMYSLGGLYISEGKYRKGASLRLKAVILLFNNKEPDYYYWWGNMFRAAGEYKKTEMLFEQAIRLDPGNVDLFLVLGQLYYYRMEEYQNAINIFHEGLKITPMNKRIINGLAWCYVQLGDLDKAEEYYSKIPSIEAEFVDTTQHFTFRHRLGYIKWLKGEKEEAMSLFQEQMKLDNETRIGLRGEGNFILKTYYYDLGVVNAFLGNREEAYLWLDSALNFGWIDLYHPEHDPLLDGIRQEERFQDFISKQREIELQRRNAFREVLYQPEFMNHIEWFFKED